MIVHVLNGDALAEVFQQTGIEGEMIICRECLMEGPVDANGLFGFWNARAEFISGTFRQNKLDYYQKVKAEFDRIERLPPNAEVNLWFENDLFCQTNMWFIVSLLGKRNMTRVFRVSPLKSQKNWNGFGDHGAADLRVCLDEREVMTHGDFRLGEYLWNAYRTANLPVLGLLSKSLSPCYPFLEEVCQAEIDRKSSARPQVALKEILSLGYTNFDDIFSKFREREGIYGYGDSQVGLMLKEMPGHSVQRKRNSVRKIDS